MSASLKQYIEAAREKKLNDEQIRTSLVSAGWPEDQVQGALANTEDDLIPPPPPPQLGHIGMWIGFLYIIFFISLYILAGAVGWLLHDWIDNAMPNPTNVSDYLAGDKSYIQGLIATILVSYPIFLVLALILKNQLLKKPQISNLRSRKILIYITLIVTFLIMLSNIIMTLYEFLGGGFTANAIYHLMITLSVAGGIFWYFISEVIHDRKTT